MKTISQSIIDFLEYMEVEKGRASSSAKNYDRYLRAFANFAKEKEIDSPAKIDLELVRQFRLAQNRKGIAKATQNYYLIALRTFLKYLAKRQIKTLEANQIELAKTDERQITFLTDDELEDILKQPNLKTLHGRRDKAILDLLFSTGLRVSELANLKKDDINLGKKEFSVRGKGGKVRVVFTDETAQTSLKNYLNLRQDPSDYLFISYGHTDSQIKNQKSKIKNITPRSIQRMIKKYALAAGITKDVTPHVMRHSFATDLLMAGADLRAVQALLGHSSITTTQIYTHVTDQHLQEVHQAFHGRRKKDAPSERGE